MSDFDSLLRPAEWSDAFFGYVPAQQANGDRALLTEAARAFLEVYPNCPYDTTWLVSDFLKRC